MRRLFRLALFGRLAADGANDVVGAVDERTMFARPTRIRGRGRFRGRSRPQRARGQRDEFFAFLAGEKIVFVIVRFAFARARRASHSIIPPISASVSASSSAFVATLTLFLL